MAFKMKGWSAFTKNRDKALHNKKSPLNKNGDDEQKRFKEWANTEEGKKALNDMQTKRLEAMSGAAKPLYFDVLGGTKYIQYKLGKKLFDWGKKFL